MVGKVLEAANSDSILFFSVALIGGSLTLLVIVVPDENEGVGAI